MTAMICQHLDGLSSDSFPSPTSPGACEDCLREGTSWVGLRLCRECGHVGCCDSSPQRHATRHFHATGHPVIRAITPASAQWTWCYVHELTGSLAPYPGDVDPEVIHR
jgi:monovalent cation/hydrogen antiporter